VSATQPAAWLKAKASVQRYGTIDATSVFYLLTKIRSPHKIRG